ncbi:MAG: response regulator [Verrucomicrobiota bacterium]
MAHVKKILYVEDSENDIELTTEALRGLSLANEIVVARDGVEALDYLYSRGKYQNRNQELPVLILLDLKLPKISGLEVLKTIKSDPNLRTVPVVVLTSSREEKDLVEGYRLGVNAYVVKPVDFQQFVQSVRNLGCFWAVINEPPPKGITT